jgi:hypothetical protein
MSDHDLERWTNSSRKHFQRKREDVQFDAEKTKLTRGKVRVRVRVRVCAALPSS